MKFSPIKFQGALAAAGVGIMPFLYLQFSAPHGKGAIRFVEILNQGLASSFFIKLLLGIMLVFTILHFFLTAVYIIQMVKWIRSGTEFNVFLSSPQTNIGIFSPVISLAMSINVMFGPVVFFFSMPQAMIQAMILPAFIIYGILWSILLLLEARVFRGWFANPVEMEKLNFGWLLDVFAFGMVALAGSGISALSAHNKIASLSAAMTFLTLAIGGFLFATKLIILLYRQFKTEKLPEKPFLLSYFTVVPILCLFGISIYKLNIYLKTRFGYDLSAFSFFIILLSFSAAVFCIFLIVYLLREYFKYEFNKKEFYPSLWSPVCALVGFEVLGIYIYGNYFQNQGLLLVCYISTVGASVLYLSNLFRYFRYTR